MHHEERPFLLRLARYAIPLVILVFYLTAAMGFSFTPDGAYLALQWVRNVAEGLGFHGFTPMPDGGSASPLWVALISAGTALRLDPVLLAKILSLFFSCLVILLSYLLAHDVLDDLVAALCLALIVATNGWLMHLAPAGTPHALLAVLLLATLFSLLRHDVILASVFLALSILMAWQAVFLAVPLVVDLWIVSGSQARSLRLLTMGYVLLTAIVVPWVLFTQYRGIPWRPELPPSGLSLAVGPFSHALLFILAAGVIVAMGFLVARRFHDDWLGPRHIVAWTWMLWLTFCALVWDAGFLLVVVPLAAAYTMYALKILAARLGHAGKAYAAIFGFTAVVLVFHQLDIAKDRQTIMSDAQETVPVLTELAYWTRSAVPEEASLSSEWPGLVGYITGRPVIPLREGEQPSTEFAITADRELFNYVALRSAARPVDPLPDVERFRYLVWKRR